MTLPRRSPHIPARTRKRRQPSLTLIGLMIGVFLLSAVWALAIPLPLNGIREFQPDERSHIAVIEYIAQRHALPPYSPPFYETMHPPLYHIAAGILYALLSPLMGETAALLGLRLLSAVMGCAVVWLVYRTTQRVLGREAAGFAALLIALIPMRASTGGGISNEHLAVLGSTGALAVMAGGLWDGFTPRRIALLLLWTAIGIGSKLTCLGLVPAALIALGWDALARGETRGRFSRLVQRTIAVIALVVLTLGGWLWDNARTYGDPLRKAAIDRMWDPIQPGYRGVLAERGFSPARYLVSMFHTAWTSFWGVFDSMRQPLPAPVFGLLLLFQIIVLGGILLAGRRGTLLRRGPRRGPRRALVASWGLCGFSAVAMYVIYNWSHYSPQGRYFFVLLLPFGLTSAFGWQMALPGSVRRLATPLLLLFLLIVNIYVLRNASVPHGTITSVGRRNSGSV